MKRIINNIPFKFMQIITVLFVLAFAVNAQDSLKSSSPVQRLTFSDDSKELANSLVRLTGVSPEKSDKISQILIDYRKDISNARNDAIKKGQDINKSSDVTGKTAKQDFDGILGNDVEPLYEGATPELMEDYKDADKKADEAIQDVLDNQSAKSEYENVKGSWWGTVKHKVFSSLTKNTEGQTK